MIAALPRLLVCACVFMCGLQAADHLSADIALFHSDSLRPLVVNSMQLAVQQLRQHPDAHSCEVGRVMHASCLNPALQLTVAGTYHC
jgi:hypothetical protein